VFGGYESFFVASSGASAAFLGLLFVAFTVVDREESDARVRERRVVLAGSAFLALADAFFVSVLALTGGPVVFGLSSLGMALIGLAATSRLMPRAARAGNFARGFPTRKLNIMFATVSAGGYTVQSGLSAALLTDPHSATLQRALLVMIVILYGSGLTRAWEITGIRGGEPDHNAGVRD
jgi:hypothetical protein